MTETENEKLMKLAKEVTKKIDLNAVEVTLILEIMKDYLNKMNAAFKLKKFRSSKEFIEARKIVIEIENKLDDIQKQNEKEFEILTELKKSGKN